MKMPPDFAEALSEPPPSLLLAVRSVEDAQVGVTEVLGLLERSPIEIVEATPTGEHTVSRAQWELEVRARFEDDDEPQEFRVWLEAAPHAESELLAGIDWRGILPEDADATRDAGWAMGVSTQLGDRPLRSYHRQARLLATVAPDAVLAFDVNAATPHPARWLAELADSRTPPSPATLFAIHSVYDEDQDSGAWLHTHGLLRCGSIELEMLDVPRDGAGLMGQLLNTVATMFLESGVPDPDEVFMPGQDIELLWLPWERGIDKVAKNALGNLADRDGPQHQGVRGVLFAPGRGLLGRRKYELPSKHLETMENNPLLYVSTMETERMALLATERLGQFRGLHERFGEDEEYVFLIKLGYLVDGADPDGSDREHLWFIVHAIDDDEVDATLTNAPYSVSSLREGQRGLHALDKMSDWTILCGHGRFDADNIGELIRMIADG